MHDLTGFQRDLLYVIAGLDDPKGLAIKDELEDYYQKEIHHGRLYPNLDTLVDKGLVEKGSQDRRTNFYTLTRRGRREIEDRNDWQEHYAEELAA
jgi:DNA-binding PadR family transcriptional regulator